MQYLKIFENKENEKKTFYNSNLIQHNSYFNRNNNIDDDDDDNNNVIFKQIYANDTNKHLIKTKNH